MDFSAKIVYNLLIEKHRRYQETDNVPIFPMRTNQELVIINLKEIAKSMGVSTASVSFVLNGKPGVSDALRENIAQILTREGYTVRPLDRSAEPRPVLPAQRIQFVKFKQDGYFVEHNGDYITKMVDGAEQAAKENGYALGIVNVDRDSITPTLESFNYDSTVAGVIFLGTEFYASESATLSILNCPLVVVDTRLGSTSFDTVSIDEQMGVYHALRHLAELGHRKITYLRSAVKNEESLEREDGFEAAIIRLGLDRSQIGYLDALPDAEDSYLVLHEALQKNPYRANAYFAANDTLAIGALRALKQSGLRVPEDVSLVGFDDLTIGAAVDPPLTSVAIGKYEIGYIAVSRLMEQKNRGKSGFSVKMLVGANLVVRGSTGPAPKE